jgi:hypothetical protein
MAFYQDDLYTVSSGNNIYNYWNPFVTKFDSSSFYSWETDNNPLYDVEERTEYLWEKLGWPTSSIPGLAFSVSASVDPNLSVSSNVFTTVQDAIDALPEILRFPTCIEVAKASDLGELNLDNIKCMGDGALEIVNRCYSDLSGADDHVLVTTSAVEGAQLASSGSLFSTMQQVSALHLSAQTSSLYLDNDAISLYTNKFLDDTMGTSYMNVAMADSLNKLVALGPNVTFDAPDVKYPTSPYQDTTTDVSCLDFGGVPLAETRRRASGVPGTQVNGIYTSNYFRKIKISNCDGPIYIRGFIVNASGATATFDQNNYGIHVSNSEGVVLENCGATRAKIAGLFCDNSNISLNRRFLSARNYDHDTRGDIDDYGILAVNSRLSFDSDLYTYGLDNAISVGHQKYGVQLNNSEITGGYAVNAAQSTGSVLNATQCEIGIDLRSSVIDLDGFIDVYNNTKGIHAKASTLKVDSLLVANSTDEGLELDDSTLFYNKNLVKPNSFPTIDNGYNYYLTKSFFVLNGQNILTRSSSIKPVYSDSMPDKYGEFSLLESHGFDGSAAGCQLPSVETHNSFIEIVHPYSWMFSQNADRPTMGRHFAILNSSTAILRGSSGGASIIHNYTSPSIGAQVYVEGGSKLNISGPTHIGQTDYAVVCDNNSVVNFTPHLASDSESLALDEWSLSSTDNHTSVEVYGKNACLVANNNSVIRMRDLGAFTPLWETALSSTGDQLYYSTDSDALTGHDVLTSAGSFVFYPYTQGSETVWQNARAIQTQLNITVAPPRVFNSITTANGVDYNYFLKWLGNPSDTAALQRLYTNGGVCVKATNNSTVDVKNVNFHATKANADEVFLDPTINKAEGCNDLRIWSFATGSTLNASQLSVSSSYPSYAGYTGPRALYYSGVGYDCSNAAYGAFSLDPYTDGQRFVPNLPQWRRFNPNLGSYPELAGLESVSGQGYFEDMPLSSLSILDFFGLGCSACSGIEQVENSLERQYFEAWSVKRYNADNPYGFGVSGTPLNSGPFRLFLEIDPAAKALSYLDASNVEVYDNRPFQTLAQGYFLSGSCSATTSSMDNFYPSLRMVTASAYENDGSGLAVSGFSGSGYYHPKDFVMPHRYNILLDESASNVFANSKNASIPILGREKLVNIYRPTNADGGTNSLALSGFGNGFRVTSIFDIEKDL